MQVVSFTSLIAAMIGIGVGIDYALFIVTRYRQGLHDGLEPEDAVATAITTSGRAVLFAGSTVVIALMGMFLMGLSFINGLAVGAALAVLVTMVGVGHPAARHARLRRAATSTSCMCPALHRSAAGASGRGSVLVPLEPAHPAPALALRRSAPSPCSSSWPCRSPTSASATPTPATTRRARPAAQAYDLLSAGFGPGYNGPLTVAARLPQPSDLAVVQRLGRGPQDRPRCGERRTGRDQQPRPSRPPPSSR